MMTGRPTPFAPTLAYFAFHVKPVLAVGRHADAPVNPRGETITSE